MGPEIIIAIVIGVLFVVVGGYFFIRYLKSKNSNTIYNENITKIIINLGGNDNIISITPKMSRVEIVLHNYDLVNKEELKLLGVQGISKTSQKITLVVGNEIAKDLENTIITTCKTRGLYWD